MSEETKEEVTQKTERVRNPMVRRVLLVLGVLVLGIACFVAGFFMPHSLGGPGIGSTTVKESELDRTIATYTSSLGSGEVTVRQVIEQSGSLDAAKNSDGTYAVPSASSVLMVTRNIIFATEAQNRGIEVTDAELSDYAEQTLGNNEFAAIAEDYGMSVDGVKALLSNAVLVNKLHDEIVGDVQTGDAPAAPEQPAEGSEAVPTQNYADYIFALAGGEWDAEAGAWRDPDGEYASALAGYEITNEGATYEAAQTAYYLAYQDYSTAESGASATWSDFVNSLTADATITILTLNA